MAVWSGRNRLTFTYNNDETFIFVNWMLDVLNNNNIMVYTKDEN